MDLLKEHPFNFRYYLLTTKPKGDGKSIIYICYFYSPNNITASEPTQIETVDLPNFGEIWDDSKTIKLSVFDDQMQINLFNDNIIDYVTKSKNISQIKLINLTETYDKLVLEPKTFLAMTKSCNNIYIDLKASSFRTTKVKYPFLKKLIIKSGNWLLDDNTAIEADTIDITKCTVNVFNNTNVDNNFYFNLLVENLLYAGNLNIYSTIKSVFSNTNVSNPDAYVNKSKLNMNFVHIFGSETIQKDAIHERILIQKFNKVMINNITVDDEIKYGIIFKFSHLASAAINEINRNIKEVYNGSMILMDALGTLNLHHLNIVIKEDASITKDFALISFIPDKSELKRSINIYDTEIINKSPIEIPICLLRNIEISSLYMASCKFGNGIVPFKKDKDSKLLKLYYNKCEINSTKDYNVEGAVKISMNDSNFSLPGNTLNFDCENLSISGGMLEFKKLHFYNTDTMITKLTVEKAELIGNEVFYDNSKASASMPYFDNFNKYKVNNFISDHLKPTFNGTVFKFDSIEMTAESSVLMTDVILVPLTDKAKLKFNSSISLNCLYNASDNKIIDIILNDTEKFYSRNKISLTNGGNNDYRFKFNTNAPLTCVFNKTDPDYIEFNMDKNYSDIFQKSFINIKPVDINKCNTKILNNSEKICKISDKVYNGLDEYSYTIDKINDL